MTLPAVLRHLAALAVGLVMSFLAVLAYRTAPPWGLLLVLATSFAVPGRLLVSRWPRTGATYAAGWLAFLVYALRGRPEGDYLLASDTLGSVLLAGALVMFALGLVSVTRSGPPST